MVGSKEISLIKYNTFEDGKGGLFVIDLTWKLFSQTGNIETYLLLKEMEDDHGTREVDPLSDMEGPLELSDSFFSDFTKL